MLRRQVLVSSGVRRSEVVDVEAFRLYVQPDLRLVSEETTRKHLHRSSKGS